MQPTNGYVGGNLNVPSQQLTSQQQQQLQQMMLLQQGGQFGNVMGYNAQYAMPAASVGQAQRPASATPPPATAQVQQTQQQQPGLQRQQQAPVARVSDTGDDGFDLDDIPSPGGTPPGAGTGPAATQQQQLHQQNLQYNQPAVSQPAAFIHQQTGLQQQQQQLLLQQHQQRQQQQQQLQQLSGQQGRSQPPMPQQVHGQQQPQPRAAHQQPMHVSHPGLGAQMGHFSKQQQQPQHGITAATRPGAVNAAQSQLSAAEQSALHSRKAGTIPNAAMKVSQRQPAPGQELPAAAQAALAARQGQQQQPPTAPQGQQQQQQLQQYSGQQTAPAPATAAVGAAGVKRKREAPPLLPAPEDALTLDTVIYRIRQHLPLTAAAAAGGGGPAVDGPAVSVDDILRRYESAKAKAAAAAPKTGKAGGRDKRADDEHRLLPEGQLKRLMELQGLNKSFRLQPELAEELMKLTDNFVTEAVEFGCALAARRSSKVLRTSDLAMYMQRTYHLHIPGFSKEYTPYRRPVASDLHKSRSVAVRKAQLQPQQQGGAQGTAGKAVGSGVRFSVD